MPPSGNERLRPLSGQSAACRAVPTLRELADSRGQTADFTALLLWPDQWRYRQLNQVLSGSPGRLSRGCDMTYALYNGLRPNKEGEETSLVNLRPNGIILTSTFYLK